MAAKKPDTTPDEDTIRKTAYTIWEEEGRPTGRDTHHWIAAEARMKAKAASTPKTAVKLAGDAKPAKPKPAAKPKAAKPKT